MLIEQYGEDLVMEALCRVLIKKLEEICKRQ